MSETLREGVEGVLREVEELSDASSELMSDFEDGFCEGTRAAVELIRALLADTAPTPDEVGGA